MSELALYRKYRSGNFYEVLGQDHVVRTLTSALSSGRLRHAYLFTGPRGVGKTSVARLLARALNCTGDPKPCNECPNCLTAINSSLDIIEMDAASNRSIDSIRDLREKVNLGPTAGRYKVYIIDEVHMLTTEAFNALLKTLEEPPSHAVFILATTEAHKLPETIISRTQAFNFKPITMADLTAHLSEIAKREKIDIAPEALEIIATTARGGFRDAISLLDQLAGSGTITATRVRDMLGYTAAEEIAALSEAIATSNTTAALEITTRLDNNGAQAGMVATQLAALWRQVLLTASNATKTTDPLVTRLASQVSPSQVTTVIEALLEIGRSPWPQLALETTLVRLTIPSTTPPTPPAPKPAAQSKQPAVKSTAKATPAPATPASTSETETPAGTPQSQLWPKVLIHIKSQNNSLAALLQMYPVDFGPDEITIKPRFNFHRDLFMKSANRTTIEAAVTKVYGRSIKISARTEEAGRTSKRKQPDKTAELVSSALEILGGEIIE